MYELTIDNGDVGHVWKQNVEADRTVGPSRNDFSEITEDEASAHYRLAKAVMHLTEATFEVNAAYEALELIASI